MMHDYAGKLPFSGSDPSTGKTVPLRGKQGLHFLLLSVVKSRSRKELQNFRFIGN
jgi:hypothetical protein